jgi:tetratricopeptide (TPR) repeat protein
MQTDDPELLWDRAEALLAAADAADVTQVGEVIDRLAAVGQAGRADVLAGQVAILTEAEPPDIVLERLTAGAEAMAEDGDHLGATLAHRLAAEALAWLGRLGAAEAELDKALVAARPAGDRRRITAALAAAPRTALWGPSPVVRSNGRCLDVLRILRMNPGNRHVEAAALRCQAVLEAVRGRFVPAREILDSARVTLQELGLSTELHELGDYAGMIELLAGDPLAAETHFRAALDGFTTLGVGPGAGQAAALLARALVEQGRDAEAIEHTRFAEEHAGGYLKTIITLLGRRGHGPRRGARRGPGRRGVGAGPPRGHPRRTHRRPARQGRRRYGTGPGPAHAWPY